MADELHLSELELALLKHLYDNPHEWSTQALVMQLKKVSPSDQAKGLEAFKETQYAIETLIAAKLAKGERHRTAEALIYFDEIKLTPAGEQEAIKQSRKKK